MKRKLTTNSRVVKDIFAQYSNTYIALCELINNAIQAEATKIELDIDYAKEGELTKTLIKSLKIKDDGIGVNLSEVDKRLLNIGTDIKKDGKGIGRFASLQLGKNVQIETVGFDERLKQFTLTKIPLKADYFSNDKNIAEVEIETSDEVLEGKHKTYYQVEIKDFYDSVETESQAKKKVVDKLLYPKIKDVIFETYPIPIFNSKIKIFVNGAYINPQVYVEGVPERKPYKFTDKKGKEHDVFFTFFKLKADVGKIKTFLTVKNAGINTIAGTLEYDADWLSPKIGSHFVYVSSDLFTVDLFRNLDISEMDESLKHLNQFIKNTLNEYFQTKNKAFDQFLEKLKGDKYYPYKNKTASHLEVLVFDKLVYLIEEKYHLLNKNNELREIVYPLIENSIENGALTNVLQHMLKRNDNLSEKFNRLMEQVDLESVLAFSSKVAKKSADLERLETLVALETNEATSELQRLLTSMLWIFGEQFSAANNLLSDKQASKKLLALRDKTMAASGGKKAGLFLFNENILAEEKREVLVLELKALSLKLSSQEAQQAKNYVAAIEADKIFSNQTQYRIVLVGSSINAPLQAELKTSRKQNPNTPYFYWSNNTGNIEIWIAEWSEIFEHNKNKLKYLSSELALQDQSLTKQIRKDFEDLDFEKVKSKLKKVK